MYHAQQSYFPQPTHNHSVSYVAAPFRDTHTITNSYDFHSFAKHAQLYHLQNIYGTTQIKPVTAKNNYQTLKNRSYDQAALQPVSYTSPFLHRTRPITQFIGASDDVINYIHDIYEKLTRRTLHNVILMIASVEKLKSIMPNYNPNILGFALNSNGFGPHHIYIKEDYLDSVLLTVGHEIGHVLTPTLPRKVDEEAKAFAFELAWAKTIKEYNIADLASAIQIHIPAQNGLHNVALQFVFHALSKGMSPLELFEQIANGHTKVDTISDEIL
jgi:hypothetical protein